MEFIGTPIRAPLLELSILAWLVIGYFFRDRSEYNGSIAVWIAPLNLLNEKIVAVTIAGLSVYAATHMKEADTGIFIVSTIASFLIIFIGYSTIKRSYKVALLLPILLISAFESYFIVNYFLHLLDSDIQSKNNIQQITSIIIMITSTAIINHYFLRNFMFYQKFMVKLENTYNQLSYNQKLTISVHESSHLLMYRYFKELPEDIELLLFNRAKAYYKNAQGLVISKIPIHSTREFIEWRMMLSISGIRGELLVFNNHSHGSESDFQEWAKWAHIFLKNYNKNYVSQPTTYIQIKKNKELEQTLFHYQANIIDDYLYKNKSILLNLARQALVFNKLSYKQIHPHFKRIKIVKGIPLESS